MAPTDHAQVLRIFDRRPVACHLHLDWHSLSHLLDAPYLRCWVAKDHGTIQSLIGATLYTPPPNQRRTDQPGAWLRLALSDGSSSVPALDRLWGTLLDELCAAGMRQVYLLTMEPWIVPFGKRWGFRQANAVISLRRESRRIPAASLPQGLSIHKADTAVLDAIVSLDAAAFEPMWQYDRGMMEMAQRHAATFTFIEQQGQIYGYQLSTWHIESGHLARLAIHPDLQGQGLGGILMGDMLSFFAGRGVYTITVNTQADNLASQRLYKRYGFEPVNQRVDVWTLEI